MSCFPLGLSATIHQIQTIFCPYWLKMKRIISTFVSTNQGVPGGSWEKVLILDNPKLFRIILVINFEFTYMRNQTLPFDDRLEGEVYNPFKTIDRNPEISIKVFCCYRGIEE